MPPLDSTPSPSSLFRPGENCCAVSQAARATVHIDGEAYFDAFVRAAERAERLIVILAWDFDSRTVLRFDENGKPRETLGEFLNNLCVRKPRLRVKILDWDFPIVYGTDREYSPIFGLSWEPHRHIQFRFDDTHPVAGSHHQKIVAIDDKIAFVGGLDLTNKRWDSPKHAPDDARRTFGDQPYPPFHDVMLAVDGEAAESLCRVARERWRAATGRKIRPVKVASDPWPEDMPVEMRDVTVSISCTQPKVGNNQGLRHIEKLYLDMIARARSYIYIENQYFTSDAVGDALEARLREPGGPEIVVATRLLSHGWLEEHTMHVLRIKLVRRLREADTEGRFHAYYPHVEGLKEGTCLDLHSKVMIVDDEWLRVGSSNLSNRSMAVDTEADATIEAAGNPEIRKGIRRFRDTLLAEHMGVESVEEFAKVAEGSRRLSDAIKHFDRGQQRRLAYLETPEVSEALMKAAAIGDMEQPIGIDAMVHDLAHTEAVVPVEKAARRPWLTLAIVAAVFGGFAALWRYTPLATIVTSDKVLAVANAFADNWWAPLILVLAYTPASMIMFPRPLITMAAVVVFGPWEGFTYAMIGVVLAGSVGYALGRMVHRDTVRRLAGGRLNKLTAVLQRRGILAVTLVRLVPIAPYLVVNVVMGAMRIRFHHFVIGTTLGMLPGGLAATVLSDQVAVALMNPARVNPWLIAAGVALFATLAWSGNRLLGWLDERDRRKQRMRERNP